MFMKLYEIIMLYRKYVGIALFMLMSFIATHANSAEPYQLSAGFNLSQSTSSFTFGEDSKSTLKNMSLTYYLQPITASNGPLATRAFLSKSAFVRGIFGISSPDRGSDADIIGFQSRFVTQTNLIFEFTYEQENREFTDGKDITVGVGKYLDNSSLASISLRSSNDFSDSKTLRGSYQRIIEASAPQTYIGYGLGLDYIDTDNDSAIRGRAYGTYYFSRSLSGGASISYLDADTSNTSFSIYGSNFFTEKLSAGLRFTRSSSSDNSDTDSIGVGVNFRF